MLMVNVKHVIMRNKIEEILSQMVNGNDEPEQTIDKLCDLHNVRLCFPTDEAIEDIAEASYPSLGGYHDTSYHERRGFEEGAEWVINMIKNSEKWEK